MIRKLQKMGVPAHICAVGLYCKAPRAHLRHARAALAMAPQRRPKGSLSLTLFYKISLLPKLHLEQSVCKFSGTVSPPFDQGIIWSTCNSTEGAFAGDAPHAQHLK